VHGLGPQQQGGVGGGGGGVGVGGTGKRKEREAEAGSTGVYEQPQREEQLSAGVNDSYGGQGRRDSSGVSAMVIDEVHSGEVKTALDRLFLHVPDLPDTRPTTA